MPASFIFFSVVVTFVAVRADSLPVKWSAIAVLLALGLWVGAVNMAIVVRYLRTGRGRSMVPLLASCAWRGLPYRFRTRRHGRRCRCSDPAEVSHRDDNLASSHTQAVVTPPEPSSNSAGADFGPPSDTLGFTFRAWAEAAQLGPLGGER